MQDQSSICSNSIPDTHYFAYKDKLYPIKYDFFKYSSEYFRINEDEIKASKIIQLVEQNEHDINLSDNSIQNFIDFVQSKTITLTDENVSELNFLSRKYLVNNLTKYTEDYIKKHHKDLILQVLIYRQNDSEFETEIYEDTLINNFLDYIDKKQLLDLNFNIIHRILNKYISIQNEQETKSELYTADTKYIDFLFKCLDKYGREASILFNNIDIYKTGPTYLNKLLKEYSNTFDFHLLNSIFVKELYEKENQLFQQMCDYKMSEEKNKEELTKMSQTIKEFKYEVQQSFIDCSKETDQNLSLNLETVMKEIKGIKEEMEQMKSFYSKELEEQKESINKSKNQQEKKSINISNDIQSIKKEIEQIKTNYSKELDDQKESLKQTKDQQNESIQNLSKEINELKSSYSKELNEQKQSLSSIENKQEKSSSSLSNDIQSIKKEIEQIKSNYSKQLDDQKDSLKQANLQQNENMQTLLKGINDIKASCTKVIEDQKQALTQKEKLQKEQYQNLEKDVQELKKKIESSQVRRTQRPVSNKKLISQSPPDKEPNNSPLGQKSRNISQNMSNQVRANRVLSSPFDDDSDDNPLNLFSPFNLSMRGSMPQVIEPICTFEASLRTGITQKWFICRTCKLINGFGMCEVCANRCHKGHDVAFQGVESGCFCDCPIKCSCKCGTNNMNHPCTRDMFLGKPVTQPMYRCRNCDESICICQYCAIKHHRGHKLVYLGVVENKVCHNEDLNIFSRSGLIFKRRITPDSDS